VARTVAALPAIGALAALAALAAIAALDPAAAMAAPAPAALAPAISAPSAMSATSVTPAAPAVVAGARPPAAAAAAVASGAGRKIKPSALAQIGALLAEKASRTPAQKKLDSHLLYAAKLARGEALPGGVDVRRPVQAMVRPDAQGRALVEIAAQVDDELLAALRGLGAEVVAARPEAGEVRARLALGSLEKAAALPGVRFIRPAMRPRHNAGPDSDGDVAHAAGATRTALGIDGTGVKVGVLADGVDSLGAEQTAGNLPGGVTVLSGQAGSGDEGTAMLEVVYTLAPGAQLFFATGDASQAAMAANVTALQAAGCQVIVDDVTWEDEAAFQDGPIGKAINKAAAAGALYFSAAGDNGNLDSGTSGTWEGDFVDSGMTIPAVNNVEGEPAPVHSFGANDFDTIAAATGDVTLKWSDPLGGSANDYDLFALSSDLSTVEEFSDNTQNGTQDPLEVLDPQPSGEVLVVVKFNGAARYLRLDTNRGQLATATAGATYGHSANPNTVTVGAVGVATASGGAFTGGAANPIEGDSSDGPRRIFFTPSGAPITAGNFLAGTGGGTVLPKVDVAAADCVTTGLASFNPFCGTSAAAPHAAAIAALALSLPTHPSTAQVRVAMEVSALDIMAAGLDNDSGHGIVMADATTHFLDDVPPLKFFTVTPCRLVDTRTAAGPLGGPSLVANGVRTFSLASHCGIPTTAKALAANITVVNPAAPGDLRLFPGDETVAPLASTINFQGGEIRANNASLQLAHDGSGTVKVQADTAGAVDLLIDVTGYFQ
jgi:hypothetical protein